MEFSEGDVLYEDNHLIAIHKPIGVLSQGDKTGDTSIIDNLKNFLKLKYNKPGNVYLAPLHRLDRPVQGVLLFAKTSIKHVILHHIYTKQLTMESLGLRLPMVFLASILQE